MSFEDIVLVLQDVSYKGRTKFWKVKSFRDLDENWGFDVWVYLPVKDRVTDKKDKIYTHYLIGPNEVKHLTPATLVRRVKNMLVYLETHEVEEQLLYKDMRVFDPHPAALGGPNVVVERKLEGEKISSIKRSVLKQLKEKRQ